MSSPLSWFDVNQPIFERFSNVDTIILLGGLLLTTLLLRMTGVWTPKGHKDLVRVPGFPIIGNLALFLKAKTVFAKICATVEKYGPLLELWIFNHRIIVIADIALARECLMRRPKTFKRTSAVVVPASILGCSTERGVFFAEGDAWSRERRLTSPAFSHKNVNGMSTAISNELGAFLHRLKAIEVGKVVQMDQEVFLYTISIIGRVAFGKLPPKADQYFFRGQIKEDCRILFELLINRLVFPFPNCIWRLSPSYQSQVKAEEANIRFTANSLDVIKNARDAALTSDDRKKGLIDSLISAKSHGDVEMTDDEIAANVKIFFLAGSDSTSVVITWCYYQLCIDDALKKELQQEVDAVLGPNFTGAEAVAVGTSLPLCNAVFKETLRLRGPVEDLILEIAGREKVKLSNGLEVYPGDEIFVHVQSLLSDPIVFPNPEKFDPYRWMSTHQTPERILEMENSFVAFGHGPRVCPGQALARLEGVAALVAMVRSYDLKLACPVSEIERVCEFVTKANKMPIILTKRTC